MLNVGSALRWLRYKNSLAKTGNLDHMGKADFHVIGHLEAGIEILKGYPISS